MDLIACIYKLRPDVTWDGDYVNGTSLETIAKTYLSNDPIPTIEECENIWPEIQEEGVVEKARLAEITEAQNTGDLKDITVNQGNDWILDKLQTVQDSVALVTDVATAKTAMNQMLIAINDIFKKEMPYLLK